MTVKSWKIVLFFGIPWSMFMVIFGTLLQGSLSYLIVVCSVTAGAFAGCIFSILIRYAASSLYESIVVEVGDEKLVKQGRSNRFVNKEQIGGKLVLTEKLLIFKSHAINSQSHQYVIYLSQVENVIMKRAFCLFNNRLCVMLRNGEILKFWVSDPRNWIRTIEVQRFGTTVRMMKPRVSDKTSISSLTN